ncbi:dimethylsulfonioproprionate lyase family protein [Vibrio kasasachensis]|uniref:dimethylsulfonioproprionate lyase family protein n=1 Tax=Vibrio kasasachensis TaxID=2910248 RepID=UPI003D0CE176
MNALVLPVSSTVLSVGEAASTTERLVKEIKASYLNQTWRQPYQSEELGEQFVNNSAWFPIADVDGPIIYNEGLMEVMLLNSDITYPSHKHSPEELYVILAGQIWWESGTESGCWKYAGELIHHLPEVAHSIKSGREPALILSLWRGGSFEIPVFTE